MTSASKYHGVNKKKTENNDFSDPTVDEVGSYVEIDSLKNYQLKADLSSKQIKLEVYQKKANNTGLPDNIKSNTESISGISLDDVKVNYNSNKPAQLNAHAYAEGSNIHLAPGQEKHLGHEAWHVVQQKQGRVKPTTEVSGVPVNDSPSLENEADIMGSKTTNSDLFSGDSAKQLSSKYQVTQRITGKDVEKGLDRGNTANDVAGLGADSASVATNDGLATDSQQELEAGTAGDVVGSTFGFVAAANSFKEAFQKGYDAFNKKPKDFAGMAGSFKSGAEGGKSFAEGVMSAGKLAGNEAFATASEAAKTFTGPIFSGISIFVNVMNMMQNTSTWSLVDGLDKGVDLSEDEVNTIRDFVSVLDRKFGLEIADFILNIIQFVACFAGPAGAAVALATKIFQTSLNLFKGVCGLVHGYFVHKEQQADERAGGGGLSKSEMDELNKHLSEFDVGQSTDGIQSSSINPFRGKKKATSIFELMKQNEKLKQIQEDLKPMTAQDEGYGDKIAAENDGIQLVDQGIAEYNTTIKPEAAPDLNRGTLDNLFKVHMSVVKSIIEQTKGRKFHYSWLKSKIFTLGKEKAVTAIENKLKESDPNFSFESNNLEYDNALSILEDTGAAGYFEEKTITAINISSNRHLFSDKEIEDKLKTLLKERAADFRATLIQTPEFADLEQKDGYDAAIDRFITLS